MIRSATADALCVTGVACVEHSFLLKGLTELLTVRQVSSSVINVERSHRDYSFKQSHRARPRLAKVFLRLVAVCQAHLLKDTNILE